MLLSKSAIKILNKKNVKEVVKIFYAFRNKEQVPLWLAEKGIRNLQSFQDALLKHNCGAWDRILQERRETHELLESQSDEELLHLWIAIKFETEFPDWAKDAFPYVMTEELFYEFLKDYHMEWVTYSILQLEASKQAADEAQREYERLRDPLNDGNCHCGDKLTPPIASECGHRPCCCWREWDDLVQIYAGMWICYNEMQKERRSLGLN